jgi:hypothetical protein
MRDWRYSSNIIDLDTRWSVVRVTPRLLYSRGKCPKYPLHRRLGGPQSQSGPCGVKKNLLSLPRIEPWPVKHYPVIIPTKLSVNIKNFRYLGTTLINQNRMPEEDKVKLGECLTSLSSDSSSPPLLPSNVKLKVHKTITLFVWM